MNPTTTSPTSALTPFRANDPGHALIAIEPFARDSSDITLIADPLHFPPDSVARITRTIAKLFESSLEAIDSRSSGPWKHPVDSGEPDGRENPDRLPCPISPGHHRQRILLSLFMNVGRVRAELAFSTVDPAKFPPEEIDLLVDRLNELLNEAPMSKRPFVSGCN